MLKKLFKGLALFGCLSIGCFVVLLFYRKNSTSFTKLYSVANGNDTLSQLIKQPVKQLWVTTEAPKARQEKTQMPAPTNKTLGPCPDTPPNLVGPLLVEFDYKRTLDEVRTHIRAPLHEGGRYKPPDCIAQQKVGE